MTRLDDTRASPPAVKRLSGRTALITGSSSGLGSHFARLYAAHGAKLVLGARRKEALDVLVAELEADGAQALAVELDVCDEASTMAAYDAAQEQFGTVDTVIANAGISSAGRSTEVDSGRLRDLLDTNVMGVMLTAREGARRLMAAGSRDSGAGRIVLVGSIAGEVNLLGEALYCASKAAVAHLGRNLAREWVRMGINVNVIQPGFILTGMADGWFGSEGGKKQIAGFHRRRLQEMQTLDEPMIWLGSDASASVTGSVITVDDGQSL